MFIADMLCNAPMRRSPQRHPLAVLRTLIGLTQKEMAAILECSVPTVQAVELGKLPLSSKLGNRISFETGVSLDWLMKGDVKAPIVNLRGQPYAQKAYEIRRAELSRPRVAISDSIHVHMVLYRTIFRITSLLQHTFNTDNFVLGAYKLEAALDVLTKEFNVPLNWGNWPDQARKMAGQYIIRELAEEMFPNSKPQALHTAPSPQSYQLPPPDLRGLTDQAIALVTKFHEEIQSAFAAKRAKQPSRKPARKLVKR